MTVTPGSPRGWTTRAVECCYNDASEQKCAGIKRPSPAHRQNIGWFYYYYYYRCIAEMEAACELHRDQSVSGCRTSVTLRRQSLAITCKQVVVGWHPYYSPRQLCGADDDIDDEFKCLFTSKTKLANDQLDMFRNIRKTFLFKGDMQRYLTKLTESYFQLLTTIQRRLHNRFW